MGSLNIESNMEIWTERWVWWSSINIRDFSISKTERKKKIPFFEMMIWTRWIVLEILERYGTLPTLTFPLLSMIIRSRQCIRYYATATFTTQLHAELFVNNVTWHTRRACAESNLLKCIRQMNGELMEMLHRLRNGWIRRSKKFDYYSR